MRIIDIGHQYELENFEAKNDPGQVLQFIKKIPDEAKNDGTLVTVADGTTNEEVLRVLIDRIQTLQLKFPCRENAIVLTNLETALLWLGKRTADRAKRGVEGKAVE